MADVPAKTDEGRRHPLLPLAATRLRFAIDGREIIRDVSFRLDSSGRTVILGPNGAGKTTLLKVLAGELATDSGERWLRPGTRIARLEQELPLATDLTVYQAVAAGLAELGELLGELIGVQANVGGVGIAMLLLGAWYLFQAGRAFLEGSKAQASVASRAMTERNTPPACRST